MGCLNRKVHDAPKARVGAAQLGHDVRARELFLACSGRAREKRIGDVHRMRRKQSHSSHCGGPERGDFLRPRPAVPPRFRAGAQGETQLLHGDLEFRRHFCD